MSELEKVLERLNEIENRLNKPLTLPINEASKVIGIGQMKLRELTFRKDFPVVKIGSKKLILMNKVDDWLVNHKGESL